MNKSVNINKSANIDKTVNIDNRESIKYKLSTIYQGNLNISTLYLPIDILTNDEIIVVETLSNWVNGMGLLAIHSTQFPNKKKHLHLYNLEINQNINLHMIISFCSNNNIVLTLEQ